MEQDKRMSEGIFLAVWRATSPSARGGWSESKLGHRQSEAFRDSDIITLPDFVKSADLLGFVNLVQSCEGFFSTGPNGGQHDLSRINKVLEIHSAAGQGGDYERTAHLIGTIARDMRHEGAKRAVDIVLERSFLRGEGAPQRRERPNAVSSRWLLFLNDDYRGGELLFPTRMLAVPPRAGRIVRWPAGIPVGRATAIDGYAFTLSGRWL